MTNESRNQFIDKLILSIRTENIGAFDENTQKGIIWFGEEGLQKILNEELPLYLDAYGNATLLRYMVNDDPKEYIKTIFDLIKEVTDDLKKIDLKFNEDYSFATTITKEPVIAINKAHTHKVITLYSECAWKQLSPFVRFIEEEESK